MSKADHNSFPTSSFTVIMKTREGRFIHTFPKVERIHRDENYDPDGHPSCVMYSVSRILSDTDGKTNYITQDTGDDIQDQANLLYLGLDRVPKENLGKNKQVGDLSRALAEELYKLGFEVRPIKKAKGKKK